MRRKVSLLLATLLMLTLCACGGKVQNQQNGGSNSYSEQSNPPAKKTSISAADFTEALLAAGYMDEESFRSKYKEKYGDEEIDEVDDYDDFAWLDEAGTRIPGLIKSEKVSGALVNVDHQLAIEDLNPVPQRYTTYAIFTEDFDPENEYTVELILYFWFDSETQTNDFYQILSKEASGVYGNSSIKGNTCVFYSGSNNSPAWSAMKKLGY